MTNEAAQAAVTELTGVPAGLLKEDEGYDGSIVFVSRLTGKRYSVESADRARLWTEEQREDIVAFGEYGGLIVYELKPWWGSLR